jgi:hypothetical protein
MYGIDPIGGGPDFHRWGARAEPAELLLRGFEQSEGLDGNRSSTAGMT